MVNRDDPDAQLIGTIIRERYKVLRLIGAGGMAAVYEVEDRRTQGRRALKLMRTEFVSQGDELLRFQREARVAESIDDEHVVRITDVDALNGVPFIVMELLHGEDLREIMDREETLAPERAIDLVVQCLGALGRAHQKGVVHRDIKPANIFVRKVDGRDFVTLLDFGISKLERQLRQSIQPDAPSTQSGIWLGSPYYMSPEQVRAHGDIDGRADLYSVGIVLFEALTGEVPYGGNDVFEIFANIDAAELPPIGRSDALSRKLEQVVRRAAAKSPDDRYDNAEEMIHALLDCIDPDCIEPGQRRGRTERADPGRTRGPRRGLSVVLATALTALLGAAAWYGLDGGAAFDLERERATPAAAATLDDAPAATAGDDAPGWELPAAPTQGPDPGTEPEATEPAPAAAVDDTVAMPVEATRIEQPPSEPAAAAPQALPLEPPLQDQASPGAPSSRVTDPGAVVLLFIPGGRFTMGSPPSEVGRVSSREGQREVAVGDFYLGRHEVQNAEFARYLAAHPSAPKPEFWGSAHYKDPHKPVVGISHEEALRFARWTGSRLPTEEEWEYACRAGTHGAHYGPLDRVAIYNRTQGPSVVGKKRANAFGLFDMLGNALELTMNETYSRGGSWGSLAPYVRAASRNLRGKRERNKYTGFRLARDAP